MWTIWRYQNHRTFEGEKQLFLLSLLLVCLVSLAHCLCTLGTDCIFLYLFNKVSYYLYLKYQVSDLIVESSLAWGGFVVSTLSPNFFS